MAAMINTIIYANLLPFFSLIVFLGFIRYNPVFDKKQSKLFFISALITLCMIGVVSLDYIILRWKELSELFPFIYLLRRMTSFLNFSLSPVIPLIVFHIYASKKVDFKMYIPALLNITLCFMSLFANIIFFIEVDNTYDRGALFFLPSITSLFYLGALIIQRDHLYNKSKKTERLFLGLVVCVLGTAMFLEISHHFLFLSWDFTAICLILYYLLLNIHRTVIDPLTKTYNRLAYNKEIEKIHKMSSCIFALMDINGFKSVNDLQGHDVGDLCLKDFANLLEKSFAVIGNVYRIGGDEFVLISKKATKEKFEECLEQAKALAKQKNISFACGWDLYTADKAIEEFIVGVDQRMYADKHTFKLEEE